MQPMTKAKQKANWIIKPEDIVPKNELFTNCCFTKTVVNRPQIYFHVKKHCHLSSSDTFLPVSILQLYIPLHIGFTHILYIYMYIFTDSTFCYKKIHPFATPAEFTFPNSPWGSCCHVAKWHWPSCADSLKAIVLERICGGKILWRTVAQDLFFLTDGIVTLILLNSFTTMCIGKLNQRASCWSGFYPGGFSWTSRFFVWA